MSANVQQLLKELGASSDPVEKRKIRRQLRAAGHSGGLGGKRTVKTKPIATVGGASVKKKVAKKGAAKAALTQEINEAKGSVVKKKVARKAAKPGVRMFSTEGD